MSVWSGETEFCLSIGGFAYAVSNKYIQTVSTKIRNNLINRALKTFGLVANAVCSTNTKAGPNLRHYDLAKVSAFPHQVNKS